MPSTPLPSEPNTPTGLVAPCRALGFDAPWRWLRLGWRDLCRAPAVSLCYGALIVVISVAVSAFAWELGRFALLATLLSGFVFVAPMLAIGLYAVSRDLDRGSTPKIARTLAVIRHTVGQGGVFVLVLTVIFLVWSRAGLMIQVFSPVTPGDSAALAQYLGIGSAVGSVFAVFTFAISAFSLPMVADRETDMITACLSSMNAVLRNKPVAALWALLLALITGLGFATAFLGLAVAMPWLAYSAWHGYREAVDAAAWPELHLPGDR